MPSIKSLRAFVLTMEQGSLTLAAQTMHLSQPAASRLLQQLEEEFGSPLFYRDSKTLSPSREAELLYPEASRILASFEELPEILDILRQDQATPLKVMAQTRCTLGLISPALARLRANNSDVSIDLAIHKRSELRRRLIWDRFDVGVFALPLHIEFAEVRLLRKVTCQVLLPNDHPLAGRASLTPDDLQKYDHVAVSALSGKSVVDEALAKEGYQLPVKHEATNAFAAVSMVQQGFGYMVTDHFTVDPIHLKNLKFIPINPAPSIEYAICVSKGVRDHPLKERFIEILIELFDESDTT